MSDKHKEFAINVGEFITINELRTKIFEYLPDSPNKQSPFIMRVHNKNVIELMGKEKFIKSVLEKGDEICAYERPVSSDKEEFLLEVKI